MMPTRKPKTAKAELLSVDKNGFEYWGLGDDVYRCQVGNRGYINTNGLPSGVRWECSYAHYLTYLAPGGKLGNQGKRGNPSRFELYKYYYVADLAKNDVAESRAKPINFHGYPTNHEGTAKHQAKELAKVLGVPITVFRSMDEGALKKQFVVHPTKADIVDYNTRVREGKASIYDDETIGNPDTTPSDPKEIAQDLRILKAKQKLVRLEGKQGNPNFNSPHFKAGVKYLKAKVKSSKGSFSTAPGVEAYLKKLDMLGTLDLDKRIGAHTYNQGFKDRLAIAKQAKQDFEDGIEAAWEQHYKDTHPSSNPGSLDSSSNLVKEFHGREPSTIDDIVTFDSFPDSLAELGELRELVIVSPHFKGKLPIGFDEDGAGVVRLASAPGGTQYVLVGGDQSLSPKSLEEDFGMNAENFGNEWQRKLVLGELVALTYFTDKHHLSGPKYQKNGCLYEHELGEEGGELPTLVYDPNNESLEIVGGSYITRAEGIRN